MWGLGVFRSSLCVRRTAHSLSELKKSIGFRPVVIRFIEGEGSVADTGELYLIRNLRDVAGGPGELRTIEFQVLAYADIIGAIDYGPYHFTIWEIGEKQEGKERWLCLRIKIGADKEASAAWATATRSGFYHGGGIPSEIVDLSSLFLRRRLKLGPIVRWDDSPRLLRAGGERWNDRQIIAGQSNLAELGQWFKLLETLDPKAHLVFILATKLYRQALELIEENPDLAYLNLVSSIEVLAQGFDVGEVTLRDLDAGLADCVERIPDSALKREIEVRILTRERLIGRRFVQFILAHIDSSFWEAPDRPSQGHIAQDQLPTLLDRVYRQRSRTLHTGEPFPPNAFTPPMQGAEIDFSSGVIVGERRWGAEDFIPYPWFFERLCNHVIKNFLRRKQIS